MNTRDQEQFESEILRQLENLYNREDIEIAVHCVRILISKERDDHEISKNN